MKTPFIARLVRFDLATHIHSTAITLLYRRCPVYIPEDCLGWASGIKSQARESYLR